MRRAQPWPGPAEIDDAAVTPTTGVGVGRSVVVPSPSWPPPFMPQQLTDPSTNRAHDESDCPDPSDSSTTLDKPRTTTGALCTLGAANPSLLPSPSCPELFPPQHRAVPSAKRAHVWMPPATTCRTLARRGTNVGVRAFAVVPFPIWPAELKPQHFTAPDLSRAQVCPSPAVNCATWLSPVTVAGVGRRVVVPSPSCPAWLFPQHFTMASVNSAHAW